MATDTPRKQIYITNAEFTFDIVFEHGAEGDRDLVPTSQDNKVTIRKSDFENEDNFAVFMRMANGIIKNKLAAAEAKAK